MNCANHHYEVNVIIDWSDYMGDLAKKKTANLLTFMLSQDYLPEHWSWTVQEQQALLSGECALVGQVILNRFKANGIDLESAYAITHDKDEHEIWDEYQNCYRSSFTSHHIHFVGKFKKGDAMPIEKIAEIIGVEESYIVKPKPGRYSYDNMISYLIHIKYPEKHRYRADSVVTLAGPNYMQIYSENHRAWMRGRAQKMIADAIPTFNELKVMIAEGNITEDELYSDPKYALLLTEHLDKIDKMLENRKEIVYRQSPEARIMRQLTPDRYEEKLKHLRQEIHRYGISLETSTDINNDQGSGQDT